MWSKNRCWCIVSNDDQGLRILTKIVTAKSNVVIKPICLTDKSSASSDDRRHSAYCYLKSCHLCSNPLPLDKEVYMYRGDLGFCSVECRERQIYLDETKEMEISSQRILSSFCAGRCETRKLLDEFRRRRHPLPCQKSRVIFS